MRLSSLPPRNRRKGSCCGWGFVVRVCTPVLAMLLSKEVVFLLVNCLFHSSLTTKKRRFMYITCLMIFNCTSENFGSLLKSWLPYSFVLLLCCPPTCLAAIINGVWPKESLASGSALASSTIRNSSWEPPQTNVANDCRQHQVKDG